MSDRVTIEFDDSEFQRALASYLTETQKSVSEVVNKKALFICLHASKEVPIGNVKDDWTKESKLFNAVATGGTTLGIPQKGAFVKGEGNKKAARTIFSRRASAKGYSRFVWRKLAGELGGKSGKASSKIDHAKATRAKPSLRPFATLAIEGLKQEHVDKIMQPALQRAVDKEAASMVEYLADRQSKLAAKRSSRH